MADDEIERAEEVVVTPEAPEFVKCRKSTRVELRTRRAKRTKRT